MIPAGAPFLHDRGSTASTMWRVSLALAPAAAWGAWLFGLHAALVLLVAIATAVLAEWLAELVVRKRSIADGSAFLTGMLVGMVLPAGVPFYVPFAASLFAIVVVKWSFGGLGGNWMNPALAGSVFVYYSWPKAFTDFGLPRLWHPTATGPVASPLVFVHGAAGAGDPLSALANGAYPAGPAAEAVSQWLTATLHLSFDPHLFDLLIGSVPGSIGEASTLLLIVGAAFLLRRKIIGWSIPIAFLLSFLALTWVAGMIQRGGRFAVGELLFHLFTGGVVLAAFFMLTDPVTSPASRGGRLFFGVGAGLLTFVIQRFGSAGEAVPLAVILMNITVPAVNRAARRSRIARKEAVIE